MLADPAYRRKDLARLEESLAALGTPVPEAFAGFYRRYVGPFTSPTIPFVLLDVGAAAPTVLHSSLTCRREYGWPPKFLVLTEVLDNQVLVLDAESNQVLRVDFEGRDQQLLEGTLEASWPSFEAFLAEFFQAPAAA